MRRASFHDDVKMMVWTVPGRLERIATVDAEIALVYVPDRLQPLDDRRDEARVPDNHVDVDDRLGGEARNGRAADVLDGRGHACHGIDHAPTQVLELSRPARVVVHDAVGRFHEGEASPKALVRVAARSAAGRLSDTGAG